MKPVVSVVMPTHNQAAYIGEALKSVFDQTMREIEIIVIDNGSTDETAEIVKSFADPRLSYYYQADTGSPVGPRNKAIGLAKGEFVAFLDSDDLWLPEKLELQVELLRAEPEAALVFSDYHFIDSDGRIGKNWFSCCRPFRGDVFASLLRQNFIPTSTTVIRRSVIGEISGMAQEYRICHDLDFYLKIAVRHGVDYVDRSLARLRVHGASLTVNRALLYEEVMAVTEKWRGEAEGRVDIGRAAFRHIQAHYQFRAGLFRLAAGDKEIGKKHLRAAVGNYPLNALYLLAYVLSTVAGGLFGRVFDVALRRRGAVIDVHK